MYHKIHKYNKIYIFIFKPYIWVHIQSWVYINVSKVFGWSLLLCRLINLLLILNVDSYAIIDIGMAKIYLATLCRIGYLVVFTFHHADWSKSFDLKKFNKI